MQFTLEASVLTPALKRAHGVTRKSANVVLQSVLVQASTDYGGRLTLTAYDTEVAIVAEVPAKVRKPGTMLLSKEAFEYLAALKGELTLSKAGASKGVQVVRGSSSARFHEVGYPEDFPTVPRPEVQLGALNGSALLEMLRRVPHACSTDNARPALSGCYLHPVGSGKHAMVASDGKRIATLTRSLGEVVLPQKGAVLPATAAVKVRQLLEEVAEGWSFGAGDGYALLRREGLSLLCSLVEAPFPEYARVTALRGPTLPVPREGLLASLERVALAGKEVSLELEEGGALRFKARDEKTGNVGEDTLQVPGRRFTPGRAWFQYKYLREALSNAAGEEVLISLPPEENPEGAPAFILTPEEDGYLAAVMPLSMPAPPPPEAAAS